MSDVSVLGAGNMGRAMVQVLLDAGLDVTVWNRTPGRTDDLARAGARLAGSVEEAVVASPLAVAILADKSALVANLAGLDDDALGGATVLNLATGRPEQVAGCRDAAERVGLTYLDGAVSGYPQDLGTPRSRIVITGEESAWQRHRAHLELLAGRTRYLGPRLEAASALDLAVVGCLQTVSLCAFLEAVAYFRSFGGDLEVLREDGVRLLEKMRGQLDELTRAVASEEFATDQATLGVYLAGLDQVEASMHAAGRTGRLTGAARDALAVAAADGQAGQGLAAQLPYL